MNEYVIFLTPSITYQEVAVFRFTSHKICFSHPQSQQYCMLNVCHPFCMLAAVCIGHWWFQSVWFPELAISHLTMYVDMSLTMKLKAADNYLSLHRRLLKKEDIWAFLVLPPGLSDPQKIPDSTLKSARVESFRYWIVQYRIWIVQTESNRFKVLEAV